MAMSKVDYELVADALNKEVQDLMDFHEGITRQSASWSVRQIAYRLARGFAQNNPRFSMDTFMQACGLIYDATGGWHVA